MLTLLAFLIVPFCIHPNTTVCEVPEPPPPIEEMCLSVTSYWVWNDSGVMMDGWGGQCNEDCSYTASGHRLPYLAQDFQGGYAACIQDWTKLKGYPTKVVTFDEFSLFCVDNFGDPDYREPFYHDYYKRWVVPIDVLAQGVHRLVCNWSLSTGMPIEYTYME